MEQRASTTRCRTATGTPSSASCCSSACWPALHRARGLSALSQPVAPDPLAALDDRALPRRLARRRQPLPHAACSATPPTTRTSASPRTSSMFIERDADPIGLGLLSAVVTLGSFVVILWGLSAAAPLHLFGIDVDDPRLSGLGGADLRGGRHAAHASDRPAADRAQLQPAALRGRLPLQPRARARELRADRAARRRDAPRRERLLDRFGRVVANWMRIMTRHQAAHVLHRRLQSGLGGVSRSSSSARPISPARSSSAG